MQSRNKPFSPSVLHRNVLLLIGFLGVLLIAGGASRADVLGQVITRSAAWLILLVVILSAVQFKWRPVMPIAAFLFVAIGLVLIQLIPLPPSFWTALPGREVLVNSASVSAQGQPWRPLSISPSATLNALSSLIVPVVMLVLVAGLSRAEHRILTTAILLMVIISSVVALLQFSGAAFSNPLLNGDAGSVSGTFANRNHFALFAAVGMMIAPVWAFQSDKLARWRGLVALGMMVFFALIILASGSRAGLVLGVASIILGLLIARHGISKYIGGLPKRFIIPAVVGTAGLFISSVALSVSMDRAVSLDRVVTEQSIPDIRSQSLPVVFDLTVKYMPFGSGFGTFDPVFRIDEPDTSLGPKYLNHAHNDLLETVLDGGIPGLLLLAGMIGWWLWNGLLAFRSTDEESAPMRRLGWGILLLILIASIPDYPARTPMIMGMIIIAAVWLVDAPGRLKSSRRPIR